MKKRTQSFDYAQDKLSEETDVTSCNKKSYEDVYPLKPDEEQGKVKADLIISAIDFGNDL